MLQFNQVKASYGAIEALRGVSLDVRQGEIVTLIGANGAGKTTLMMSLFGQPRPNGGHILYQGQDITTLQPHDLVRHGLALVPEGRRIFSRMTVLENLQLGATVADTANFTDDLVRVCAMFPRLQERLQQRGGTLSGGEQQMLAIARALMSRPKLLLLDEPSLGLAPLAVKQIFGALRELNQAGMTIFLVEQNAHQALRLAHRGYVIVQGQIILSGTGAELLANPEIRAAYLEGQSAA